MTPPTVRHHLLFPTRFTTLAWERPQMDAALLALFEREAIFKREDYPDIADASNLLALAGRHPVLLELRDLFIEGLRCWLAAEGLRGDYALETYLFPNLSKPGEFVPAHNHLAHVSGVYYVRTAAYPDQPLLLQGGDAEYWHMDRGVLILHDPRFNASLAELTTRHYAKLFPRPGLMCLFPSYLWHSVTPHVEGFHRIAIAANFTLRAATQDPPLPSAQGTLSL